MIRKIETKVDEEKKNKKKQWGIAILLGIILFGSTFGIIIDSFGKQSGKIKLNGVAFGDMGGYWLGQQNGLNVILLNNPKLISDLPGEVKKIENYYSKPLYLYSESVEAEREIYNNLAPQNNAVVERIQKACPTGKNCSVEIPTKTCADNFIIIGYSNSSEIKQENNCVYIRAQSEEILKVTDEFILKLMNIKQ